MKMILVNHYNETSCNTMYLFSGACTQFIYENVRLVAQRSSGCKKFCQCAHASTQLDGSVTYHWVEHTCPAGTLFDSKIRVCNHADNVQCSGDYIHTSVLRLKNIRRNS
jgi:hypothetical protein